MKKLFIVIALATLAGCKSQEDVAYKYFRNNPAKLAAICATTYPVVDSVGKPESVAPANNKDYTGTIDSLAGLINQLQGRAEVDASKIAAGGQISPQDVANYKNQISTLQKAISDLRGSYVKCKPDTVRVPIYRENTAKVASLQATLQQLTTQNAVLQDNLSDMTKERNRYRLILILLAAGTALFFVIKLVYFKYFK